jgi:hypothetical protein
MNKAKKAITAKQEGSVIAHQTLRRRQIQQSKREASYQSLLSNFLLLNSDPRPMRIVAVADLRTSRHLLESQFEVDGKRYKKCDTCS